MKNSGFTLMEIALIISIIVIIGALTAPLGFSYYRLTEVDAFTNELIGNLKRAREQALASKFDDSYGIAIYPAKYVLYKGSAYGGVISDNDQQFSMLPGTTLIGPSQLFFYKTTGTSSIQSMYTVINGAEKIYINVDAQGNIQKK